MACVPGTNCDLATCINDPLCDETILHGNNIADQVFTYQASTTKSIALNMVTINPGCPSFALTAC